MDIEVISVLIKYKGHSRISRRAIAQLSVTTLLVITMHCILCAFNFSIFYYYKMYFRNIKRKTNDIYSNGASSNCKGTKGII